MKIYIPTIAAAILAPGGGVYVTVNNTVASIKWNGYVEQY
jgi:hypothetical protein